MAEVLGPTLAPESILPGAEPKLNGSLLVAEATSIEEVKKVVEGDVFYTNDVVRLLAFDLCDTTSLIWDDSGIRRRSLSRL